MLFRAGSDFSGGLHLRGERKEYWMQLCEQAANEQDPDKLMELVKEINRLLEEKEQRLQREKSRGANG
jgi:hypothetical protein